MRSAGPITASSLAGGAALFITPDAPFASASNSDAAHRTGEHDRSTQSGHASDGHRFGTTHASGSRAELHRDVRADQDTGTGGDAGEGPPFGGTGERPAFASASETLAMLEAGLAYLISDTPAGQTSAAVSERLRGLERAARLMSATRSAALSALRACRGFEDDGQTGLKPWQQFVLGVSGERARQDALRASRLVDHPCLWEALAAALVSESIVDRILAWVARLPRSVKEWACELLTQTAIVPRVSEKDLEQVAMEILRHARPGPEDDGGDGYVTVAATTDGVGRINGNLSAEVTEQVSIVLAALGKSQGPEDVRTTAQRNHDALGEAMSRLLDSGLLPEVAGRNPRVEVTMDLATLRGLPGAAGAELAWTRTRSAWLAQALACDGSLQGIVTGHPVGTARLLVLTRKLIDRLASHGRIPDMLTSTVTVRAQLIEQLLEWAAEALSGPAGLAACLRSTLQATLSTSGGRMDEHLPPDTNSRVRRSTMSGDERTDMWSGTAFAMHPTSPPTRTAVLDDHACRHKDGPPTCGGCGPYASGSAGGWDITATPEVAQVLLAATRGKSLILDVADPEDAVPYRLRRAVELRDGRCRWPGCDAPAQRAQVHHIVHRQDAGPSTLSNLVLLCGRHHLHFIHRLRWTIQLNADASVTVTSPTGRTLYDPAPIRHPRR